MNIQQARELAAQCWCERTTATAIISVGLAEVVANKILEAWKLGMSDGAKICKDEEIDRLRQEGQTLPRGEPRLLDMAITAKYCQQHILTARDAKWSNTEFSKSEPA